MGSDLGIGVESSRSSTWHSALVQVFKLITAMTVNDIERGGRRGNGTEWSTASVAKRDYRAGERRLTSRQRWRPVTPLRIAADLRGYIAARTYPMWRALASALNRWQISGRWRGQSEFARRGVGRRIRRTKRSRVDDYLLATNRGMFFRHGARQGIPSWRRQARSDCRPSRVENGKNDRDDRGTRAITRPNDGGKRERDETRREARREKDSAAEFPVPTTVTRSRGASAVPPPLDVAHRT